MHVRHHATDVPQRVRRFLVVLDVIDVPLHPRAPVPAVALVHRVRRPRRRTLDLGMRQDEFAEARVQGEPPHVPTHGEHQGARAAVHAVPRGDHLLTGYQDVVDIPDAERLGAVHPEDAADGYAAVDVGGPVQWVKDADVPSVGRCRAHDGVLLFLADQHGAPLALVQTPGEDVVRDDV